MGGGEDKLIKLKRGTKTNMQAENPVLSDGQPGYAYDSTGGILKVGDGTTAWNDLMTVANSEWNGTDIPLPVSVANGGTGATKVATALSNLNGMSKLATYYPSITLQEIDAITDGVALVRIPDGSTLSTIMGQQFCYIYQSFYSTVTSASARVQIAVGYQNPVVALRRGNGTDWTEWESLSSTIRTPITSNVDLNSFLTHGFYQCVTSAYTATNAPISETYWTLDILDFQNYTQQIYTSVTTGRKFYRYYNGNNSTWSAWSEYLSGSTLTQSEYNALSSSQRAGKLFFIVG